MEKIHSAIQKARQERDAKLTGSARATDARRIEPERKETESAAIEAVPADVTTAVESLAIPAPETAGERGAIAQSEADVAASWAELPQLKPDRATLRRNRIVAFDSGGEAACYDVLRTNVLRQMRAKGWKRLAITSPTPGCGKTTTALNLGFSLGRLHDLRTLVIEIDLRRPSMRHAMHLKPKHMVASFLSGEAPAQENLAAYGKGLAFGTNHGPTRNSAELLSSATVAEQLRALEQQFAPDITVFDMPPMLVSDDTIAFLPNVDCALLVAAAGVTTTTQIDRCERALAEQTSVLGVVLNKCQFMAPDEYYGYDYY